MSKKKTADFWQIATTFLNHQLKEIRQVSTRTIDTYRYCLNCFIDYLETKEHVPRQEVTFQCFETAILKRYQNWLLTIRHLSPKTSNLHMSAIRSLLEYASQVNIGFMPLYTSARTIPATKLPNHPIEYFTKDEMTALLAAPNNVNKTEKRNQMLLIFLYDTAARVSEAAHVRLCDLHLDAKTPYVTLLGKGRKYRNIPLMDRTVQHIRQYLKEFHGLNLKEEIPLFYSRSHGCIQELSTDTFEKMIKKYAQRCRDNGQNMPQNVHCHMIRKTRAMDLYSEGVPLTHIQQLLGHESISTTSGFYAFATLDTLSKTLDNVTPDNTPKTWEDPEVLNKLYKL